MLNTFETNSVELQAQSEDVFVFGKEFAEVLYWLIVKLVIVEVDLLDHSTFRKSFRNVHKTLVRYEVVLNRKLDEFSFASEGACNFRSTCTQKLVVGEAKAA